MDDVATKLPPKKIIDAYEASFQSGKPQSQALWDDLRDDTGSVIGAGAVMLARIWDAAWKAGGGKGNPGRLDPDKIRQCYENPAFVKSCYIGEIDQEIATPTPFVPP
jgi:hypothetical protein